MHGFLIVLTGFSFTAVLLVSAMRPARSEYSQAELKRRAVHSSAHKKEYEQMRYAAALSALLRFVSQLLLLITILLIFTLTGWFWGIALSIALLAIYPALTHIKLVTKPAQLLYARLEPALLRAMPKLHPYLQLMAHSSDMVDERLVRYNSVEELIELIQRDHEVLKDSEKRHVLASLRFSDKKVHQILTPRSVIDSISKNEFLGPLVLSELHKLGHSRLPVYDGDLDHIVGILSLRDLLSLDIKESTSVEQAMEKKVFYIHENDSLEHALGAFLRLRHHLFIVINHNRETVGLLTLEDVLEQLVGRRIIDEDDIHDDLRAVAEQESVQRNSPPGGLDV